MASCARFFFLPNDPASYSGYEILGPGDNAPCQKGRTDKYGVVSFLPHRPGKWTIKVIAESDHGGHAANVEIDVKEGLLMESFSKPLMASHAKFFIGGGLLLGVFRNMGVVGSAKTVSEFREACRERLTLRPFSRNTMPREGNFQARIL